MAQSRHTEVPDGRIRRLRAVRRPGAGDLVRRGQVTPRNCWRPPSRASRRATASSTPWSSGSTTWPGGPSRGLPDGPFRACPSCSRPDGLAGRASGPRGAPASSPTRRRRRGQRARAPAQARRTGDLRPTSTCELGLSLTCEPQLHGPTRNPWDPTRISGGSSGGAAAAVGARMLPWPTPPTASLDPRPGGLLRAGRLKPTRGRNTMAPFLARAWAGCRPSTPSPSASVTARGCSTPRPARARATPTRRRHRRAPSCRRSAPRPAGYASPSRPPRRTVRPSRRTACACCARRPRSAPTSGTRSRRPTRRSTARPSCRPSSRSPRRTPS